ncbi:MAG: hypothetical protein JWR42_711 [Marmoricola sp.]|nr:hypothetical protein [Marmoricola sp.]
MSDIDVDLPSLDTIATALDTGARGIDDLAGTTPGGIDAGPMTGVIAGMLSQVVNSAGNVSSSLTGAASLVRLSRQYYERADAEATASLTEIQQAMKP